MFVSKSKRLSSSVEGIVPTASVPAVPPPRWLVELRLTVRPLREAWMEKTVCSRFMANILMMVKVSANRLKHIHLQIYIFYWEETIFLSNSQGLPIALNEDFLILQARKCIKFSVSMIQKYSLLDFSPFSTFCSCYSFLTNSISSIIIYPSIGSLRLRTALYKPS